MEATRLVRVIEENAVLFDTWRIEIVRGATQRHYQGVIGDFTFRNQQFTFLVAQFCNSDCFRFTININDGTQLELETPDAVEITPTNDNTLEVKNLTKETLPTVWIFYRDCDRFGNILGGRCFSVAVEQIRSDDTRNAESSQWLPSCQIMDVVVVYPEETQ